MKIYNDFVKEYELKNFKYGSKDSINVYYPNHILNIRYSPASLKWKVEINSRVGKKIFEKEYPKKVDKDLFFLYDMLSEKFPRVADTLFNIFYKERT